MKEYMLIYKGGDPNWTKQPKEVIEAAMAGWGKWMAKLQQNDQLISGGSPLQYSGQRINSDGVVTDIASSEFKELVSGYSVIKAKTHEEAVEIAKNCPIFQNPNVNVELREIMQMG